jgi:hypothetical protein
MARGHGVALRMGVAYAEMQAFSPLGSVEPS